MEHLGRLSPLQASPIHQTTASSFLGSRGVTRSRLHLSHPSDAAVGFLLPGLHLLIPATFLIPVACAPEVGPALGRSTHHGIARGSLGLARCWWVNAEPRGVLASRGERPSAAAPFPFWGKEGTGRSGPWGEPSSCSEPVFAVSEGEAVNSPGLIESRCCGFGLIRPPPPPSLDNVSLKPLCKLTAFLRAEPGGSRRPWPRCTALSLPRSRPGRVGRRDPLVENGPARDVDGDGMGMLRVVGEGCSETQGCAKGSRGNSLVGRAGTGLGSFRGKKKRREISPSL